ncbi:MAG TPA: hypothetical protein VMA34_00290 [Terracidiphilus sp.]|nr:hypothetical protein [Terracidiphilus sp.]
MPAKRVYRLRWRVRLAAGVFLGISAACTTSFWLRAIRGEDDPHYAWLLLTLVFVMGGVLWTLYAFQSTVTLSDEAIEVRGLFGSKRLLLRAIRGRRTCVFAGDAEGGGTTIYLKVVPEDDRLPMLTFQKDYNFDAAFHAWFHALPDLDAMDRARGKDHFGLN